MAKLKRAAWFKMYLHQRPIMGAMSDAELGRAMKGIMDYFATGDVPELGPMETALFRSVQFFMDEAIEQYQTDVENGKKSAKARAAAREAEDSLTPLKQKEKEKDIEKEKEKREKEKEEEKDADAEADADGIFAAEPLPPPF